VEEQMQPKAFGLARKGLVPVLFVGLLCLQTIPTAGSQTTTLPDLFPALADLPQTTTLAIELDWQGLSPLSPIEANYLLELHNDRFMGKATFKVATATAVRDVVVPRDLVRAFLVAATRVELIEKSYQPRITHTDDYPSSAVVVNTRRGDLTIETRSQPRRSTSGKYWDATPWAMYYSGRTFVVTADDLDQALDALWPHLQYDEITGELAKQLKSSHDQGR
jgi:hypothetical protein